MTSSFATIPQTSRTCGGTALVVDDEFAVRFLHQQALESDGYEVVAVADGRTALSAIGSNDFELVLLDSRMPGLSGLEVLAAIRAQQLTLPVILVTGAADTDDRIAGLDGGADAYLQKPIGPRELRSRVRALMRGRDAAIDSAIHRSSADDARDRARIETVIAEVAYHPVFQPIVSLRDRSVVAHEALTRFDDGQRPDLQFDEAARVGLATELAMATLHASITSSARLAVEVPLHVNVSPSLLTNADLPALLSSSGRPIVVELTEHEQIDDYAALSRSLEALGGNVGLAIDDTGAGYASMAHILALRPAEVKLDRGWVGGVDIDPARRALVAGMVSFATATNTVLVAEGVETESEAAVLTELGVCRGQGYLFGRPERP